MDTVVRTLYRILAKGSLDADLMNEICVELQRLDPESWRDGCYRRRDDKETPTG